MALYLVLLLPPAAGLLARLVRSPRLTERVSLAGALLTCGAGLALSLDVVAAGPRTALGGLLYVVGRRWFPSRGLVKGLTFGLWLLMVLGWVVIDGDNVDFRLFVPSAVSVGMFASLYLCFGLVVAPIVERLDRGGGRRPANRLLVVTGYAILAAAVILGLTRDIAALRAIF